MVPDHHSPERSLEPAGGSVPPPGVSPAPSPRPTPASAPRAEAPSGDSEPLTAEQAEAVARVVAMASEKPDAGALISRAVAGTLIAIAVLIGSMVVLAVLVAR